MTTSYYADRANLRRLQTLHPEWTQKELAAALGRCVSWVKKWLKRLREASPNDEQVLQGLSRARKHPPDKTAPLVVERILAIRDAPPEGLQRVPGPEAILYYLPRDPELQAAQVSLPHSSRTIYRILKRNDRILASPKRLREPMERPEPMSSWQIDFKDASSVPADPAGKQQHVVEVLNVVDMGTSVLLDAHVRADFTAETCLEALAQTLRTYGIPKSITLDRDTRWVGSPHGSDFPSALIRFAESLGIFINVCAPQHPQQNAFVERYHRTYQEECLAVHRPSTLQQVCEVTTTFQQHYNVERPNQALSCGNQPPRSAFAVLPVLPPLPQTVDPDRWLDAVDGLHLERKVNAHGMVSVDLRHYYISSQLIGKRVVLRLDAATHSMQVFHEQHPIKQLSLKGLVGAPLSFEAFLAHMARQARAQHRLRSLQERRVRMTSFPSV